MTEQPDLFRHAAWLKALDELPEPRSGWLKRQVMWAHDRASIYPHGAWTPTTVLRPVHVEDRMPDVYFIRVPFPRSSVTLWAFETEAARDTFVSVFSAFDARSIS